MTYPEVSLDGFTKSRIAQGKKDYERMVKNNRGKTMRGDPFLPWDSLNVFEQWTWVQDAVVR